MLASLSYSPVFTGTVAGRDGHLYRTDVVAASWSGPSVPLPVVGWRVDWTTAGGDQATTPLAPVSTSRATLVVRDAGGRLAATAGAPDGQWGLVIRRLTGNPSLKPADGGPGVCWFGYALPELYSDTPYAASSLTTLVFADGLFLLESRPFMGDGTTEPGVFGIGTTATGEVRQGQTPISALAYHLHDLSAVAAYARSGNDTSGLVTAVDWRPWMPGTTLTGGTGVLGDPLARVYVPTSVWLDADGGTVSVLEALRETLSGFNARLFQSGGRWHVVQRGAVCRAAGSPGDPLVLTRRVYSGPAPMEAAPQQVSDATQDMVVDTRSWHQMGPHEAYRRGVTPPVRSVTATYPVSLEDLLYNGSFERSTDSEVEADGWIPDPDLEAGGARVELLSSEIEGFGATFGDEYAMKVTGAIAPSTFRGTMQTVPISLPGSKDWDLRLRARLYSNLGESEARGLAGGVILTVVRPDGTELQLSRQRIALQGPALVGADARLYVDPLPGAVNERVIPEGAELYFWRDGSGTGGPDDDYVGRATVTRSALGGDRVIRADVEVDGTNEDLKLKEGDRTEIYVWTPSATKFILDGFAPAALTGTSTPANGGNESWPVDLFAASVADDGGAVAGDLTVRLVGPLPPNTPAIALYVDDVALTFSVQGAQGRALSATSTSAGGRAGLSVAIDDVGFGDGPLPDSDGALVARGEDESFLPTVQGADTGWKEGAYASAEASTGVPLLLLRAHDAHAQLSGPLETTATTYLLRGGAALAPEHVVRHNSLTRLSQAAAAGTDTVYLSAAPPAGATLVFPDATSAEVQSVVGAAGLYQVTIAAPLVTDQVEGGRVAYDLLTAWDTFGWDGGEGTVALFATSLQLSAGSVDELSITA